MQIPQERRGALLPHSGSPQTIEVDDLDNPAKSGVQPLLTPEQWEKVTQTEEQHRQQEHQFKADMLRQANPPEPKSPHQTTNPK